MALTHEMDQITTRLLQALESGALPPEGRAAGQKLMTQLSQSTRIAVVGFKGAGKTALVNMLLGAPLMPDLDGIAAVEVRYGATAQVQVALADGSLRSGAGLVQPQRLPAGTVRVTQTLPDPRLKDRSFLEVCLSEPGAEPLRLLDWMAKRADIAIWCSQGFDDRERALWAHAPDHLKDHSFLVLTKADRLLMKGELQARIAALQPVVADEFLCLYPLATLQAAAARSGGGTATAMGNHDALWLSSGGKALVEGIRHEVDQARTADLDHASMLLDHYKLMPEAAQAPVPAPKPEAERGPVAVETHAPAAVPQPALQPAPQPTPQTTPRPVVDAETVIDKALALLQDCADELMTSSSGSMGAVSAAAGDRILERCGIAAEDLVRLLSQGEGLPGDLDTLRDDAVEGEQMLMLLRLERGETAAEDALTVLFQLKKEIAERAQP